MFLHPLENVQNICSHCPFDRGLLSFDDGLNNSFWSKNYCLVLKWNSKSSAGENGRKFELQFWTLKRVGLSPVWIRFHAQLESFSKWWLASHTLPLGWESLISNLALQRVEIEATGICPQMQQDSKVKQHFAYKDGVAKKLHKIWQWNKALSFCDIDGFFEFWKMKCQRSCPALMRLVSSKSFSVERNKFPGKKEQKMHPKFLRCGFSEWEIQPFKSGGNSNKKKSIQQLFVKWGENVSGL